MLTLRTLPFRNAAFFRRGNVPVLLGVAVGAAVLTGALLVGDSLRSSLKEKADRQLAGVTAAWVGPRMIRDVVTSGMGPGANPAIILSGTVEVPARPATGDDRQKISGVTILGVRLAGPPALPVIPKVETRDAVAFVSTTVAARLRISDGDFIRLGVEQYSTVPRGSLLGRRGADDAIQSLTVRAYVLPALFAANQFSLVPSPQSPLNVYVPLEFLQERLRLEGKCNAVLYSMPAVKRGGEWFAQSLELPDWGIRVTVPPKRGAYVSVESESLVLDGPTVAAVERACVKLGLRHERTFVYLANEIAAGKEAIPYSIVCATNVTAAGPLGPLLPPGVATLADDELVLADWEESPLKGKKLGDVVTITYFKPEMEAGEETATATFKLKGFVPIVDAVARPTPIPLPAADPDLTPPFPGITDKLKIGDWNPPFPFDNKVIQRRDEKFWDDYKTTPKAYITTAAGVKLFGSRFGTVTSIRVAPAGNETPEQTAEKLTAAIRSELDPAAAGFVLEDTRARLAAASKGGTDFGGLFLGFSFFLIGAALLLVGLLFRLNVERRASQVGLLLASGYPARSVRRILLVEGLIVAGLGAALGIVLAIAFARGMLALLVSLWPDPESVSFLRVHIGPWTLGIGFVATVLMAAIAIWFSLRGLTKISVPALLRSVTEKPVSGAVSRPGLAGWIGPVVLAVVGLGLLFAGPTQTNPDIRAMTFFSGGGLLLAAGLWAVRRLLKLLATSPRPSRSVVGLAVRNAGRNPGRSLLTAGLLAAAAFLLVAVESFRRSPDKDFGAKTGGSGGFSLLGESAVPVFRPPDSPAGRDDLELALEKAYQDLPGDEPASKRAKADLAALDGTTIVPLRLKGGDDASCLNLYQAGKPRLLGVPDSFIDRGGFRFSDTKAESAEEKQNPWLLLKKSQPDGAVPFVVEQNSAMWMLKIGVGDMLELPDEAGTPTKFRLVATLVDCPFQSELFLSDVEFRKLYPRQEGYRVFLIDAPADKRDKVASILETGLRANGLTVTPSKDKVAGFQAVVGTYLTLFQLLGGFGLLLGVLGLAVVLLRGVAERAGELALLRAVGYSSGSLRKLVLVETLFLLVLGLGVGVLAALASVAPQSAAELGAPLGRLAAVLAVVAIAGVLAALAATRFALHVPLVPALRTE